MSEIETSGLARSRFTLVLLFAVSVSLPPLGRSADFPDVIDQVRPSIVGVGTAYPPRQPSRKGETVAYLGTGFVVGDGRQVITNFHVIPKKLNSKRNQTLAIFAGRGDKAKGYEARVVRTDKKRDLALLEFRGKTLPAMKIGDSTRVREGQDIAFTGFPLGMVLGLYPVTHRGMIAAISPIVRPMENPRAVNANQVRRLRNPFDAFQLDATAYPGNSGSPVFLPETGEVVGVINSVFVKESKETLLQQPSGISYAIPSVYIEKLLSGE